MDISVTLNRRRLIDHSSDSEPIAEWELLSPRRSVLPDVDYKLATPTAQLRRKIDDRYAIERAEDEGMTVRAGYRRLPGGNNQRGHHAHANAYR